MSEDGWAIHYGRDLWAFTFDRGRAPLLAAKLHGTIHAMQFCEERPMNLKEQLERFEGRRHEAYPDPLTGGAPWTIGIGHTGPEVVPGLVWTDAEIDAAFALDVEHATEQCMAYFPWFATMSEPRQAVLIGMVFQMGINGVLKFKNTLHQMELGNWELAAEGIRFSKWAEQTPSRALALANQLEFDAWA